MCEVLYNFMCVNVFMHMYLYVCVLIYRLVSCHVSDAPDSLQLIKTP